MARIERFEDIDAWKKARQMTGAVYQVTGAGDFSRDFALRDQLRRAAVSVMSNIAEGFGRQGDKEFRQFLATARGSANEVQAQLYVALDAGYFTEPEFAKLYALAGDTIRLIGGFMRYLATTELRGPKLR